MRASRISRKTGYKWLERYAGSGASGLADQSRAPKTTPHKLADDGAEAIIQARRNHPDWGARKLLAWLTTHRPELAERLPAASTANAVLARTGLLTPQRGRRRWKHPGGARLTTSAPNDVWTADEKASSGLEMDRSVIRSRLPMVIVATCWLVVGCPRLSNSA